MAFFKKLLACTYFVEKDDMPAGSRRASENSVARSSQLRESRARMRYSVLLTGYNTNLEIAMDSIVVDYSEKVCTSAFTTIYKGYINLPSTSSNMPVAIKMLKENAEIIFFKALVRELKILSSLQEHENIVSLLGACTSNIHLGQINIVLEHCEKGSLENYLRSHRSGFVNKFERAPILAYESENIYENFNAVGGGALSTCDLLNWTIQVARGMEYLAGNNLIHWELATRSIFLNQRLVAKLGDFHSLHKIQPGADYFVLTEETVPLPWKWMALESLKERKFSSKSDVWTYGVTFWEIFSLGEDPYVGSKYGPDFIQGLERGNRPYQHQYASEGLYKLMLECWSEEPVMRPTFSCIISRLSVVVNELNIIPYSDMVWKG